LIKYVTYLILLLSSTFCFAQVPFSKNYTSANGLPSNETYTIASDNQGYLWIGTDRGVCKFDGVRFTTYDISNGLSSNFVNKIFFSPKGTLWVLCGVAQNQLFYLQNGTFLPYKFNTQLKQELSQSRGAIVDVLFKDEQPSHYSCYRHASFGLDALGRIIDKFATNNQTISYDTKNNLVALNPLFRERNSKYEYTLRIAHDNTSEISNYGATVANTYLKLLNLSNGKKIIASNSHLFTLNENNQLLQTKFLPQLAINIFEDSYKNIWICNFQEGLDCYAKGDLSQNPLHYFSNRRITSITQDYSKSYWVSAHDNGIYYIPNLQMQQLKLPTLNEVELVKGIASSMQVPLVFTTNMAQVCAYNNSAWKSILPSNNKYLNAVKEIALDDQSSSIIVTSARSNIVYNTKSNTCNVITEGSNTCLLKNNFLYNGLSASTLSITDLSTKQTTAPIALIAKPFSLFIAADKSVFIGTDEGLGTITDGKFLSLFKDSINVRITAIAQLSNGTIILSTLGAGFYFIKNNKIICHSKSLISKENIINKFILNNDTIWAATQAGIIHFDGKKIENIKYNFLPYLSSYLVKDITDLSYNNNRLFLLSDNNIYQVAITNNLKESTRPKLYVNSIFVNNQNIGEVKSEFALGTSENRIQFNYSGISFLHGDGLQYQYTLHEQGAKENWKNTKELNLDFIKLSAGTYVFKLKCFGNNNIASDIKTFTFSIAKPVWLRWWFIVGILAIISWLIHRYFLWKSTEDAAEMRTKTTMLTLQQQALTSQINPHFIFNIISNIQSYVLAENKLVAYNYLTKFATLMRSSLQNSMHQWVSLAAEKTLISNYLDLEKIRFKQLNYSINIDEDIDQNSLRIPSMLLQPIIENAVKHGIYYLLDLEGIITITIAFEDDNLLCNIADNGVGRIKSASLLIKAEEHKSQGIYITKTRIELLQKQMQKPNLYEIIDLPEHKGTIVKFYLPYKRNT
jgi:ligand-binding sensor domain-containing protein